MRVLIMMENFKAGGGGNENSTQQIIQRLLQRDHQVTLIANKIQGDITALEGTHLIAADGPATSKTPGFLQYVGWAKKQRKQIEHDVSLSMTTAVPADLIQPRSGTIRETLRRNIAMRPPGYWRLAKRFVVLTSPKQNALLRAERITMHDPSVKRFLPNSDYAADQLRAHYRISEERIHMIPNAVDPPSVTIEESTQLNIQFRKKHGLESSDIVYAFIAMNPRLKGAYPLIHSFNQAVQHHPNIHLFMAGRLDKRLEAWLPQLKHNQHIKFLGAINDPEPLYAACDVVVLPSFYDPASKVVLEALIRGVPAMSSAWNGASQWIMDPSGVQPMHSPLSNYYQHRNLREGAAGYIIGDPMNESAMLEGLRLMTSATTRRRFKKKLIRLDPHLDMDEHVNSLIRHMKELAD